MKKKWIKRIILIVILSVIGYGMFYIKARLPIITAYAAKDMCSCVFIANRNPEDVVNNEFQFSLIKYANAEVDMENKSVTASVFGMGDKTAYYHPQKGCAILNNKDAKSYLANIDDFNFTATSVKEQPLLVNTEDNLINYEVLDKAVSCHFKENDPEKPFGTRAVVVLKGGKVIAEEYADGFDQNSKHLGWSMTKSVFSALIGIAIKQDYITSVDEKSLFKEWKGDERKQITLKQLLQMNSGLEWTEDYADVSEATLMLYESDNMVDFVKDCKMEAKPGDHWEYSSGSSNLLSGLLKQRMNYDTYLEFPYKELFNTIGASSFILETDASGSYVASSYAWATARDWAKFGQLYLQKGNWNGQNIFPEGWIEFTTEEANDSKGGYGAQFWLPTKDEYPDAPEGMYFADGFQGQRVFILPSHDLVIVRLGLTRFDQPDYNVLVRDIVSAIK